jgi:hypothetical protein
MGNKKRGKKEQEWGIKLSLFATTSLHGDAALKSDRRVKFS